MTVTAPNVADFADQRAPKFFDDGHLLERERALKVLAAVQTAAQNEMAFEQRAGVAENLQDFVLCHRGDFMSKVQSSKSKIVAAVCDRRILQTATLIELAATRFFWLPASEF